MIATELPTVRTYFSTEDPLGYLPRTPICTYKKGAIIVPDEAGTLYVIHKGVTATEVLTAGGRQVYLNIRTKDDILGLETPTGSSELAIRCLTEVEVMSWTRQRLSELARQKPEILPALMETVVRQLAESLASHSMLATKNTAQRLATVLCTLKRKVGVKDKDTNQMVIQKPFCTHRLLSGLTATTREITSSLMRQFQRRGWVEYNRTRIVIRHEEDFTPLLEGKMSIPFGKRKS